MKTTDLSRLTVTHLMKEVKETGQDVVEGLSAHPREISPKYFYDETGSQLFEQICELPEYYLTRTETAVLKASAKAIARATGPCELIELGSGSATKTRILFDAYQQENHPLHYIPVDVSDTMLTQSAQQLLTDYPQMTVQAIASTYEPALAHLPAQQLPKRMITFIGSSIGNLQPKACDRFIARIAQSLSTGDYVLLGIDLQKETAILEAAYNDTQGITAAFNLNMLRHLNHQFDANFQLEQFFHIAKYNTQSHQIEMYLESLIEQSVTLKALNFTILLEKGEQILTEISRKFSLSSMSETLSRHHLPVLETFTDANGWFALLLCQRM